MTEAAEEGFWLLEVEAVVEEGAELEGVEA